MAEKQNEIANFVMQWLVGIDSQNVVHFIFRREVTQSHRDSNSTTSNVLAAPVAWLSWKSKSPTALGGRIPNPCSQPICGSVIRAVIDVVEGYRSRHPAIDNSRYFLLHKESNGAFCEKEVFPERFCDWQGAD